MYIYICVCVCVFMCIYMCVCVHPREKSPPTRTAPAKLPAAPLRRHTRLYHRIRGEHSPTARVRCAALPACIFTTTYEGNTAPQRAFDV